MEETKNDGWKKSEVTSHGERRQEIEEEMEEGGR